MKYTLEVVESYVENNLSKALTVAERILDKPISQESLNGIIGGKNGVYRVEPIKFNDPDLYVSEWIKSHEGLYEVEKDKDYEKSVHRVHKLLENDFLREFIKLYLIRTWLRKNIKKS